MCIVKIKYNLIMKINGKEYWVSGKGSYSLINEVLALPPQSIIVYKYDHKPIVSMKHYNYGSTKCCKR